MKASPALILIISTAAMAAAHPDYVLIKGKLDAVMSRTVASCDSRGMRITQQTQNTLVCVENYKRQRFTLVLLGANVRVSWTFEDALGPRDGYDGENSLTLQALN